jgi:hypothetical protein
MLTVRANLQDRVGRQAGTLPPHQRGYLWTVRHLVDSELGYPHHGLGRRVSDQDLYHPPALELFFAAASRQLADGSFVAAVLPLNRTRCKVQERQSGRASDPICRTPAPSAGCRQDPADQLGRLDGNAYSEAGQRDHATLGVVDTGSSRAGAGLSRYRAQPAEQLIGTETDSADGQAHQRRRDT